jgi:hypothetical protein
MERLTFIFKGTVGSIHVAAAGSTTMLETSYQTVLHHISENSHLINACSVDEI